MQKLGIYELVKGVHAEIKELLKDSEIKEEPYFELDSLDLELNIVITDTSEAGFKFIVVSAEAKYEKEQVSKIKLSFKPLHPMKILKTEIKRQKIDLRKSKPNEVKPEK
ncbi:MAG: trypco2 family protein [Candidatus Aenigmatarchaeota archaeon]